MLSRRRYKLIFFIWILTFNLKGRYTRGSLLPQHAPATRSRGKAPSSAPTISSEKICCATKLLLPSFAPSYQTSLIWGSKLQGQNCCTILFQEQAPSYVLKFALLERVSGARSLVYTAGACFRSKLHRVYWLRYLPGSMFRERVSGASFFVCTGWSTYPGASFGSVFQEQAPSCVPALIIHQKFSPASRDWICPSSGEYLSEWCSPFFKTRMLRKIFER